MSNANLMSRVLFIAGIGFGVLTPGASGAAFGQSKLPPCPNDQNARYHNCFGTYVWANGDKYVGEWLDNKKNGQGTYTFSNGDKYVGGFKDGWRNGQGTFKFADGDKYVGEYVGEFKDDKRNGQGTFTFTNGDKYVGEWRDDKYNGRGTFTFANGEKYVGEFQNNDYHGLGVLYAPDGSVKQEGVWENDKFVRTASVPWLQSPSTVSVAPSTSSVPAAQVAVPAATARSRLPPCPSDQNARLHNCFGSYNWPYGDKYVGEWQDNKRNGQGTYTFADGDKYVGEWKDNKRNGHGSFAFANGEKYVGEFKSGNYHGFGVLYAPDGSVKQEGAWEDGKFVRSAYVPWKKLPSAAASPAASAPAQQTAPAAQAVLSAAPVGRRVALIIGNAKYKHDAALQNPINDAQLLASTLKTIGFQSVTVKTDLTREATILALREFATVADNADWVMIYYSGHGIEFGGANYMIPIDAQLKVDRDIDIETVNIGQVMNTIEGASRLRMIVLDACRNNPFASQMRRTMSSRSLGRGLARIEPEAGTLVVYAAKHGEVALDGEGKNSPFIQAMVKRIQQKPGLEVRRLFDLVRDDVVAATSRKQQPFSYGSISGSEDFYFSP